MECKVADEKSEDNDYERDVIIKLEAIAKWYEWDFKYDEYNEDNFSWGFFYQLWI